MIKKDVKTNWTCDFEHETLGRSRCWSNSYWSYRIPRSRDCWTYASTNKCLGRPEAFGRIQRSEVGRIHHLSEVSSQNWGRRILVTKWCKYLVLNIVYFSPSTIARISEKQQLLTVPDLGENMAAVQSLLKKHIAFENDLTIHKGCCTEVVTAGQKLVDEENYHAEKIIQRCEQVHENFLDS